MKTPAMPLRFDLRDAHANAPRALPLLVSLLVGIQAGAQHATELASVDAGGTQQVAAPPAFDGALHASLSHDGRYVVFHTRDTKLDPAHQPTGERQVYVRDRAARTTRLVSQTTGTSTLLIPPDSFDPSLSASGCAVAFTSTRDNHVLSTPVVDSNNMDDVFVRWNVPASGAFDACTSNGLDLLVSAYLDGFGNITSPCSSSFQPCISGNGQWVAFTNQGLPGASCGLPLPLGAQPAGSWQPNVFLADLSSNPPQLTLVSDFSINGLVTAFGGSQFPVASYDGRFVAFESWVTFTGEGFDGGELDIWRYDRLLNSIILVSDFIPPSNPDFSTASISSDGSVVAYDNNRDVFVTEISAGGLQTSVLTDWALGAGGRDPSISPDGRFVAYERWEASGDHTLWIFDRVTAQTARLDVDALGQPVAGVASLWRTALGTGALEAAFASTGSLFVHKDTNAVADVFVHAPQDDFRNYCYGDGSGTACPCGNAPTPQHGGCPHSFSPDGARLRGAGVSTLSFDSAALVASELPATTLVWFEYSATPISNGVVVGDGLRCLAGTPAVLGSTNAVNGVASMGHNAQIGPWLSAATYATAGQTQYFQVRYRNSAAFCTASTTNFTNAVRTTWTP